MNKLVALIVGGVVVVGGGVAFVVVRGHDKKAVTVTSSATGKSVEVKTGNDALIAVDACDVLTDAVAKQVLGDTATKGETAAGNASSDDVSVSNCTYFKKTVTAGSALAQAQATETAGLLVRAAKTKTGADSNKAIFATDKLPSGAQAVSGYGDKAFFNPQFGQLNVLVGGNYYIISHHVGVNATKGTLDQAKQLADAVKNNLK